jgi:Icc-related predicted phosphoesterase
VIAGYNEPGSAALLSYLEEHSPTHMYYGHVHQPKLAETTIGATRVVNIGAYYRSTGRAWDHS